MSARLAVVAGAVLVLAIVVSLVVVAIRQDGARDALQDIRNQDQEAGDAADRARSGFDNCPDGLWDYGSGQCRRASPRGGH